MERYGKKKALKIVQKLTAANDTIGKTVQSDPSGAMELLIQCQEAAILLGDNLEDRYARSDQEKIESLIKILEDYCENLYQLSTGLSDEAACRRLFKKIRRQLTQLDSGIRCGLPADRMEVVFLPYKASMWDSLESVWRAAREDEDCDAYVIPIPYYDKNPDGSFREEHYEGSLYPDDVPITRYDAYDFEGHKPDVIFIHNPYDECNRVTSVHPFFYSKNLKRFAGKLIYIPYFILGEIELNDKAAIDNMKHFCTVPGVLSADKVIVQSETMRQIYIKVLTKVSGNTKEARDYWRDKIDGAGSPKLDRINGAMKKEGEIPESWQKVIKKKDGGFKKTVLYNTSVGALLQHDRRMLRKMQSVFEIFRENREEVALLWRPHPLIEATISAMRPHLWEEYRELAEWYKGEGWGIYDDTADLDRAIAMSDAYYGDGSSLVQLYEKTGKPIMIQNTECVLNARYRRLRFIDYLDDGGGIWFCALYTKGLFRFDKASRKTRLVCFLPAETLHEAYRALCLKGQKLYIAPLYANDIAVYDLAEQRLERIALQVDTDQHKRMPEGASRKARPAGGCAPAGSAQSGMSSERLANFSNIYMFGKYAFFVPLSFGAVVRLDTETGGIEYFREFAELLLPITHNKNAFWFSHSCVADGKIYMPSSCANALIEFDMNSCASTMYRLGDEALSYSMICYDGVYFWILGYNGDTITVWSAQNGVADRIKLNHAGKYNHIFTFGGAVFRVPCCGELTCDRISRWDHRSVSAIKLKLEKNEQWSVSEIFKDNNAALCVKKQDEKIFVYSTERDSLCIFDETGKCLDEYIFEVCDEDYKRFIYSQSERLGACIEKEDGDTILSEDFSDKNLPYFLEYLLASGREAHRKDGMEKNYGKCIFENVKKEVF